MNHIATTVEEAIAAYYKCLTFTRGEFADLDGLSRLFHADGRISPPVEDIGLIRHLSVDEFCLRYSAKLDELTVYGACERQIWSSKEEFGDIAQVWSYYEFAINGSAHRERGIKSFQLARMNRRWQIMSLTWVRETPDKPLRRRWRDPGNE